MTKKYKSKAYTDEHLTFIKELYEGGTEWAEIEQQFNIAFEKSIGKKTAEALRKTYHRYADFEFSDDEMVKNIRAAHNAKKNKSKTAKENKLILEYMDKQEELLDNLKGYIKSTKLKKIKLPKVKKTRGKKNMTMELMLTDLHYGKLTKHFNYKVARQRMSKLAQVFIDEISRESKNFNVERAIVYLGGDIVESSTMHKEESLVNCEFGNMEQIRASIESLFEDAIRPIASTGIKVHIPAVTGNHSRIFPNKTYNNPGKEYMSWVIYNVLKMLCKESGLKNVTFDIPEGVYTTVDIYGSTYLYEHGDHFKHTELAITSHLAKRSKQIGKIIDGVRFGHLHNYLVMSRGIAVRNSSLVGDDGYSEILGFDSEASQTINYYIETKNRPTPFYKSFCVYLEENNE